MGIEVVLEFRRWSLLTLTYSGIQQYSAVVLINMLSYYFYINMLFHEKVVFGWWQKRQCSDMLYTLYSSCQTLLTIL